MIIWEWGTLIAQFVVISPMLIFLFWWWRNNEYLKREDERIKKLWRERDNNP